MSNRLNAATLVAACLVALPALADDKPSSPPVAAPAAVKPAPVAPPAAKPERPAPPTELKLLPGDKAPAIDIAHWVKGAHVDQFEPGNVYVVEFWATWCGPCRQSMPHLTSLQEKFKDYKVTFIGVSDEPLPTVKGFLDKPEWAEKTQYTLATDPDRSTHRSYMEAALQRGIPTAFIVGKDGTVQWIGHPMGIDEPLEKVVRDQWDVKSARSAFETAMKGEVERMKLDAAMVKATAEGDWEQAYGLLEKMAALDANMAPYFRAQRFEMMLAHAAPDAAYAYGRELLAQLGDDAQTLNQIAWAVVDNEGVQKRDLDFALAAATKANTASKGENAAVLDTLARIYWDKGDKAKAIETQKKAVEHAPDNPMGEEIRATLKKYEGK